VTEVAQKVALPAFLKKRLQAFRIGQGSDQYYLLKDPRNDDTHKLEPWQFFLLEVLPGCDNYPKLLGIFEDRFGQSTSQSEIESLFELVAGKKLFGLSALSHPLLAEFNKQRNEEKSAKPMKERIAEAKEKAAAQSQENAENALPPGISEALSFDNNMKQLRWKLFNPKALLKLLTPALSPLRFLMYALPVLLVTGVFLFSRYFTFVEEDITLMLQGVSMIEHALISMVTVNLSVTFLTMLVAHNFRANVYGLGIVLYMGFFPRFCAMMTDVQQFTRRERMWLHAAPLLYRLALFSVAILVWFNTRGYESFTSSFALILAIASAISFLITVNPLVKSNGYHFVAALLDTPKLRQKAYKALLNKMKGNVYQEANAELLAAYALASTVFMIVLFVVVLLLLGKFLKIYLGGVGVLITCFVALTFFYRMVSRFIRINEAHERATQFERWRNRTLTSKEKEEKNQVKVSSTAVYIKRALLVTILGLLFVPYSYEPGGSFVILPDQKQEVTSDISGIVSVINFKGGENLKKGEAIGSLMHGDSLAQMNKLEALMLEQQAVIDELKSRPRAEDVKLAESMLDVELTRSRFSRAKVNRLEKLHKTGTVSFEELDDARREHRIDLAQTAEKRANLDVVKAGATPDQIAAAEAKLLSYQEERDYYKEKVDLSTLYMPFDGRLITMHLQQKVGSFLERGEPLAIVENTSTVLAQIDIPEADIAYVELGSSVRIRPQAFYSMDFNGQVLSVDSNVSEERMGKVVRVITTLDNTDGLLKTGMSGYAKIDSQTLPVWKVFSLAIVRFVEVEMWSWIP